MSPESVSNLRAEQPGLRVVPVVYYFPAIAPRPVPAARPKAAATALKISLTVVSKSDGKPIGGADVVAFTDFANRVGAGGKTNSKGLVSLSLGAASKKVERLYIYSEKGFWNVLKKNIILTTGLTVPMLPIDLSFTDSLRHFYGNSPDDAGEKVKVGVIDTGIAAHPDLVIDGGENTVVGEDPQDFGDNGHGHGTHVAGIIAARGAPPSGIRGLAPAVTLRSYRVFGKNAEGASNFSIAKAVDRAVKDGCHLINMSLGGGPQDEATHSAIADARAAGTLVSPPTAMMIGRPLVFRQRTPLHWPYQLSDARGHSQAERLKPAMWLPLSAKTKRTSSPHSPTSDQRRTLPARASESFPRSPAATPCSMGHPWRVQR